jgi:protein-tyrosine phosphatase
MIDIHSHVLADLDDGARTFDESVAMARMAAAAGTTDIVASPHSNDEFRFDPLRVETKIAELQAAVGDSPVIHYGCDFHLNLENIQDALSSPGKYSIDHRGYLLVEFSDHLIPKTTTDIFAALIASGMRPVITHPERNPLLRERLGGLEEWISQGCLVQVTAQSLLGNFGRRAKAAADTMMHRGLVHVLASDAHDLKHRPPLLRPAYDHVTEHYGRETAARLCVENPQSILCGKPIQSVARKAKSKLWCSLW